MRALQQLRLKLRAVFIRPRVEREMELELAEHVERETEELVARGVAPAEARRRALATMGRVENIREECRDARGTAAWEQLKQDAAFGVRVLCRKKTYSLMALATLALAIGSTTAVFSVIDRVLIRPLPFPEPERLVAVSDIGMRGPFETLRANCRQAEYAAHAGVRAFNTIGRDWPERVKGSEVSANFFRVLGVRPMMGRTLSDGEDRPGAARVVVLSHSFWEQRYGGRRDVIGRQITLDEAAYEVVGVMPAEFRFPAAEANFWVPVRMDPRDVGEYWGSGGLTVLARLRGGATLQTANAELRAWVPRVRAMFPWRMPDLWAVEAQVADLRDDLVAGVRLSSLLLMAAVGFVLLIAVVNVANLMIGQTAARAREFAMRTSLGANPGRLVRQLLTESLVLAAAGGGAGTVLAFGQLAALKHWLPADTPRVGEVAIDGRILAFTAVVSLGSGLLFGLLPALRARTRQPLAALEGSRAASPRARWAAMLVCAEAAFATVLVVGGALLLRSLWAMVHVDPGFRTGSVIAAELSPGPAAAGSARKMAALFDRVRDKISAYPGVRGVAAMNVLPLSREISVFSATIEDYPRAPEEPAYSLWCTAASPEHLETLGIPLLLGRRFTAADRVDAPGVVLISRAMAHRFWPGVNPIGRRLKPVWNKEWRTIVGVVEDLRTYSMAGPPAWVDGEVYVPLAQPVAAPQTLALAVRLGGDPGAFARLLPGIISEVCANCAVSRIAPMESVVAGAMEAPRSTAYLIGGFALLALVLAAAGIYGVVSHRVVCRTREVGVRLALGAGRGDVAWLVMGSSLMETVAGAAAGLGISWVVARLVRSLLFGVTEHDLTSFVVAPVMLTVIALVASAAPMVRALRIDPAQSLREG